MAPGEEGCFSGRCESGVEGAFGSGEGFLPAVEMTRAHITASSCEILCRLIAPEFLGDLSLRSNSRLDVISTEGRNLSEYPVTLRGPKLRQRVLLVVLVNHFHVHADLHLVR
jgi:hypothetical protein